MKTYKITGIDRKEWSSPDKKVIKYLNLKLNDSDTVFNGYEPRFDVAKDWKLGDIKQLILEEKLDKKGTKRWYWKLPNKSDLLQEQIDDLKKRIDKLEERLLKSNPVSIPTSSDLPF